jgi:hypothetical protein
MATESSSSASSPAKPMSSATRNAMRFTLSPLEYKLLHKHLLSRSPGLQKQVVQPDDYEKVIKASDDYNAETIRLTLKLFGASFAGLRLWEFALAKMAARGKTVT